MARFTPAFALFRIISRMSVSEILNPLCLYSRYNDKHNAEAQAKTWQRWENGQDDMKKSSEEWNHPHLVDTRKKTHGTESVPMLGTTRLWILGWALNSVHDYSSSSSSFWVKAVMICTIPCTARETTETKPRSPDTQICQRHEHSHIKVW